MNDPDLRSSCGASLFHRCVSLAGTRRNRLDVGGSESILAGTWFQVAEFGAFVVCAVLWGIASDSLGTQSPLVVLGAAGGAASYLAVAFAPAVDLGFGAVLLLRVISGTLTIGAFSLSITMLMDLSGGHGRNMGAAGTTIGLGAALGSIVGGQLTGIDPLAPRTAVQYSSLVRLRSLRRFLIGVPVAGFLSRFGESRLPTADCLLMGITTKGGVDSVEILLFRHNISQPFAEDCVLADVPHFPLNH